MTFGDVLYFVGFHVEYTALRVWRGAAFWLRELARALVRLAAVVLRPLVRAAADFRAALTHPHRLVGLLLPLAAGAALVFYVRTTLAQPFVLRVEVGGQTVGYLPGEQAFEAARADVQARISGAADWDIQPEYTLVWGAGVQTMTERETADAILRAAGGDITEGTAVYIDGTLRYITTEGDHLRRCLYAVRQLWQTEGVQTDFVHPLRLVDGIYPAVAVTPYGTLLDALRDSGLLQVKVTRYETVTKELPFETQTVEDADLDFGKTETVQAGQSGREQVTSEIVTVDGAVVSCQAVDVQLLQAPVPESFTGAYG